MSEPAGIFGAFEPLHIPFAPAPPPPKYDFGLDTLGAGWKGGSAGTDYGLHQSAYGTDIYRSILAEAKKKGIDEPAAPGYLPEYERRVRAANGSTDVLNPFEKTAYDEVQGFWTKIADARAKDPTFLKDYPMVVDGDSLQEEARRRRAVDEEASNDIYAQSTIGGKTAWWLGNFGTAVKDPLSYLPLGGAAKAETTVGAGILKGFARGATTNAALTAAEEPFVQLDANARGQDRGLKDVAIDIGLSAAFGGVLEGAHGGLAAKFATPDEKAAAHVVNRDAEIRSDSPFHPTPAGDKEHGTRLAATIAALDANKPVPQFKTRLQAESSLAGGAERFKAMVDKAEGTAKNPLSSAKGPFQFTDKTWLSYYKREIGAGGLSNAEILKKKTDRPTATRLFDALTKDNQTMLRAAGLPDSETNLYLAHFLGPKSLRVLRAAADTPVESLLPPEFITANPRVLKGKTAGEVIAWADRKMGGEGIVPEHPDVPVLREDQFASEADYREALGREAAPESGPDFALGNEPMQTVYHGSPYEFDRFSLERVGTGEGAQVFGHGLYFSEHPAVAESYRFINAPTGMGPQQNAMARGALEGARARGLSGDDAVRWARDELHRRATEAPPEQRQSVFDALNNLDEMVYNPPGHIYEAKIPATDKYLLWDKPLSEQPENVSNAFNRAWNAAIEDVRSKRRDAGIENPEAYKGPTMPDNAGDAYQGLVNIYGGDQRAASMALRDAGIVGIKYKDQLSRGTEQGTHNYVIFDDSRIRMKTSEETAQAVAAEVEAEGPHFTDPNGPDAVAQVDNTLHDLTAEDLGDTTGFRIAEEGKEITVSDALENIAKDEAAIKALKDCL